MKRMRVLIDLVVIIDIHSDIFLFSFFVIEHEQSLGTAVRPHGFTRTTRMKDNVAR